MNDIAIRVENLSKLYRIGQRRAAYGTLRESIMNLFARRDGKSDTIWALKDISFEVKRGEVVGIIGRNGAGKTTLLKILSRITEPTEGIAEIHGRVGSLLEVGTGFHPELTGRENIFLNGAILGMGKAEIKRKFDEIVDFAEIEKFMDTPVKRYSSGMYVRLAFAVAAHLQPEILLVDEVLAVGDIEFQKKCIGKMEDVAGEGRTVVVVSHNMSTVKALCSRVVLLDCGVISAIGPVDDVVAEYLGGNKVDAAEKIITDQDHLTGHKQMRVNRICLLSGALTGFTVYWQQPISVSVEIEIFEQIDGVSFGAGIKTIDGTWVSTSHHDDHGVLPRWKFEPGKYNIKFTIQNNLKPGIYKLCVGAHHQHYSRNLCHLEAVNLEVLEYMAEQGLTSLIYNPGLVNGCATWEVPERIA